MRYDKKELMSALYVLISPPLICHRGIFSEWSQAP